MYIGMPELLRLEYFGNIIFQHFGEFPYIVGSSLERPDFRDVDIRLILPDDEFEKHMGAREVESALNPIGTRRQVSGDGIRGPADA